MGRHKVTEGQTTIPLTPTEFRLLRALAERAGQLCTRRHLLEQVWDHDWADNGHSLRFYIGYLRRKLEDDPRDPKMILNQWGIGYRFEAVPSSES